MKKIYSFTLIELLVVVGIIVILAGLLLPAVMGGAEQGRITQAKSDMKAILMALNQMETTYQKMVTANSSGKYTFDGNNANGDGDAWTFSVNSTSNSYIVLGDSGKDVKNGSATKSLGTNARDAYKAFITELCGITKKSSGTATFLTNVRKLKFLEPKSGYDPSLGYNASGNDKYMWLDPWGNPYVIMINTSFSDILGKPCGSGYISAKAAIYSYGPNGTNDYGQNVATGGTKLQDDVTSWDN